MVCYSSLEEFELIFLVLSSSLSLISSLSVITSIIYKRMYQSFAYKILFYISVNDCLRSAAGFLEATHTTDLLCSLAGFIITSTYMSNLLWATCLSLTLYQIIVLEHSDLSKFYHKTWVFMNSFIVGIIFLVPVFTKTYIRTEYSCELSQDIFGLIWRYGFTYCPSYIMFSINLYFFVKIYRKVRRIGIISMKAVVFDKGFIYSIILLIIIPPLSAARIAQLFNDGCQVWFAAFICYLIATIHGFINAIFFFCNASVRETLMYERKESYDSAPCKSVLQISFRSILLIE